MPRGESMTSPTPFPQIAERAYFAAFLDLRGRPGVVVGGGPVAALKAEALLRSGVRVTVVAPQLCARLAELARDGALRHAAKRFEADDLANAEIAIAATNDRAVNAAVSSTARARRIPVNVADDAALSSFIMPSVVDRAPLQIAISSAGASPVLARTLRRLIEAAVPFAYGRLAALALRFRAASQRRHPDPEARRRFWEDVFDGPIADLMLSGREQAAADALESRLSGATQPAAAAGAAYLVSAAAADPELLTLRALRVLQSANVVLYDRSVAPAVVDLARRDAERLRVDNGSGADETLAQMLRLSREGKRVVRLTGPEALVLRRDAIEEFAAHGVALTVVPGVPI